MTEYFCPNYRLRLFMSVDLVGSTAYKGGKGRDIVQRTARQRWVDETRHFYREFPRMLNREFDKYAIDDANEGLCPQVWKTVGDEIIFCIKLEHLQHMGRCIWSFTKSLEIYSRYLEKSHIDLDVRGVAWSAAFPAPNVTVPVDQKHADVPEAQIGLQDHESVEVGGDKEPPKYEFLGKEIDAGFRVAKHAGPDRLALSLEVAYLLSNLCSNGDFNFSFRYGGREGLKGVISNRPYPIIAIDTERRAFRREVRAFEQAINGDKDAPPHLLKTFLDAFMKDEGIEFPFLPRKNEIVNDSALPKTYQDFKKYWLDEKREDIQRVKVEVQGENEEDVRKQDAEIPLQDPESLAAIEESRAKFFKKIKD